MCARASLLLVVAALIPSPEPAHAQNTRTQAEIDTDLRRLTETVEELQRQLASQAEAIVPLQSLVADVSVRTTEDSRLQSVEQRLLDLEAAASPTSTGTDVDRRIETLGNAIRTNAGRIDSNQASIAQLQTAMSAWDAAQISTEIDELRTQVNNMQGQINRLNSLILQLQNSLEQTRTDLANSVGYANSINAAVQRLASYDRR